MTPKASRTDWGQIACVPLVLLILVPFIVIAALIDLAEWLYRVYRPGHD